LERIANGNAITRRSVVFGGSANIFAPGIVSAANVRTPEQSTSRWVPRGPGVQLWDPFGVGRSDGEGKYAIEPFYKGNRSWPNIMPARRMSQILDTGFKFLRLPIDLGVLTTAGSDTILRKRIAVYISAVSELVKSNLQVIVVPAPTSQIQVRRINVPGWGNDEIFDGLSGKWMRVIAVSEVLAAAIEGLGKPSEIAFELVNEPAFTFQMPRSGYTYIQHIARLRDAVRRSAPQTTIIIPPSGFQSIDLHDGLTALTSSLFSDTNTYAGFHFFPGCWAAQGGGFYRHIHRVPYPPRVADRAQVFDKFKAAVNGDPELTPIQRAQEISYFTEQHHVDGLDTYYDTPQDEAWLFSNRMATVLRWAARNRMIARVICTEWSVDGDRTKPRVSLGADIASRVNGMIAMREALEKAKISWCINELTNPEFGEGLSDNRTFLFNEMLIRALSLK
jgi:hypothetical protein